MADYDFKYRLMQAPSLTRDGSGIVQHDIYAIAREAGSSDEWAVIPERHKTICVPAPEVQAALAAGNPVSAYKDALAGNLHTTPDPVIGWDKTSLELMMDENDQSAAAAEAANEYITVTLGLSYPVDFAI